MNRREALAMIAASASLSVHGAHAAQRPEAQHIPAGNLFNPRQFGAVVDGRNLDSPAINAAIDACNKAGGGVVYCSPGNYLCGTVVLKTNVTLYLEAGPSSWAARTLRNTRRCPAPIRRTTLDRGTCSMHAM
jgi:polygalacturonase